MKLRQLLANKLFGWDYVAWNSGGEGYVGRVRIDMCGTIYYYRHSTIKILENNNSNYDQVVWLTCPPEKYTRQSLKLKEYRKSI